MPFAKSIGAESPSYRINAGPRWAALSRRRANRRAHALDETVELGIGRYRGWRQCDRIAGEAHEQVTLERFLEHAHATQPYRARDRRHLHRSGRGEVADVDDVRLALERVDRRFELLPERREALR